MLEPWLYDSGNTQTLLTGDFNNDSLLPTWDSHPLHHSLLAYNFTLLNNLYPTREWLNHRSLIDHIHANNCQHRYSVKVIASDKSLSDHNYVLLDVFAYGAFKKLKLDETNVERTPRRVTDKARLPLFLRLNPIHLDTVDNPEEALSSPCTFMMLP